ncbi:phospho-N-acetylmuramoyl-pentapeptide-transferase [Campylobacter sp. 19-13652]|uniref:phospho-N-acetylmuramoyl-pentapeptide- transferase n=1 Tax=Campylobacter sp. 19-13652 TaxID=2840180 RepID=UPI001C74888C|nr:phospho-N-acetylmuramoyl-pentapeptide-transferase [Campylobacter sp. 19-13652]BCX80046.1 phospho-N-acetylmuramoyl-pentapeptide-transferase [Campylobacter sp. 19-13652]
MFDFLYELTGLNFFSYITVRAGFSFFIAFLMTMIAMPRFIAWARAKNANQPIYDLAPQSHQKKGKTPTMGGLVFISATILASLICVRLDNVYAIVSLLGLGLFCMVGFYDDYGKIVGGKNQSGLSARLKMLFLILVAGALCVILYFKSDLGADVYLPFYKNPVINLEIFAIVFWILVIIASANAVNLTDGLDGLATMPSIFSLASLSIFAYLSGNAVLANYLLLPKIAGLGEVVVITAALIGALLGFLWYNCYPAEVFMGDSGSLSLGGFIGLLGVMSKNEILLIIVGFVFVMETLSVILQVGSFKIFKKRIFLMAPIHHHFEMKGWVENKIIIRFWTIALLANLLALTAIKLR